MSNKTYDLNELERAWIKDSLQTERGVLLRKSRSERVGSPIHKLRQDEIAAVDALLVKFGG